MKRKVKAGLIMVVLFVVAAYLICSLSPEAYIPDDIFNGACVIVFVGGLIFG